MSATARETDAPQGGKPGVADLVRPAPATAPLAVAARLYGFLRPWLWPRFAAAFACMVAYSAMSGLVPWLVRTLIDDVFRARDERMLHALPPAIALVFLVRAAVNFGQAWLGDSVGEGIAYDLRARLQDAVLRLPVSFFDRNASATIASRLASDVALVRQALTDGAASAIRDLTTLVVLLVVAIRLDPVLSAMAFVVLPAIVFPLQVLSRRLRSLSRRGLDRMGGLSALLLESVQGARVVKAFGMEEHERRRFERENRRLLGLHLRAVRIGAFTVPMVEALAAVGIAAALSWGGASVFEGGRTAGGFLAFMTTLALIYEPFKKLTRTNNLVQAGLGAAERLFALLDEPAEATGRGLVVQGLRHSIRLEDVSFAYEGRPEVLHGIDLELRVGQVVALVGPSGGGKSTIADLLPRFYDPTRGRMLVDGVDARELDLASLRSLVAVVTQHTFLFHDTARANIAYGRPGASPEDVVAAARAAHAHDFVEALPRGYDTVVGEQGLQLSGGERQRLAIARALLKDAPVLVLDEATSALDSTSERLVQDALDALVRGRTTLVIAHRLSTIRRADRILVVDGGRIVEQGTHEELLAAGGRYRALVEAEESGRRGAGERPGAEDGNGEGRHGDQPGRGGAEALR